MRTPVFVLSPIGTNRPNFQIPGAGQIRGVFIDNPSGAWLHLMPSDDYIAPYTMGFARTFAYPVVSCDVRFEAPAGQVSTLAGDPPTIILSDEAVPDSAGSSNGGAFIERFTPVLSAWTGTQIIPATSNYLATLIPAVANKRIRLLTMNMHYVTFGIEMSSACELVVGIDTLGTGPKFSLQIDPDTKSAFQAFPEGLDWPIGFPVALIGLSDWMDSFVFIGATYQLI